MKTRFPIKKLIKLNIWLAFSTVLFFVILKILTDRGNDLLPKTILNLVFGLYILLFISFGNLIFYLIFERSGDIVSSKTKVYFLLSSFCYAMLITISIPFLYELFWNKSNEVSLLTYSLLAFLGIMMNTYILVLQHYVIIQEDRYRIDLENSKLKAINYETANQLLKQQIQPHFLFNALNILKSLYKIDVKEGEKYLISLSNFLRASVSNNETKVISLNSEMDLCKDYIEMQKIRFGDALKYSIDIPDEMLDSGCVPSLSIQPLVENAIKHNELTKQMPLSISIKYMDGRIIVTNNIKLKRVKPESTGIGLSNLSERYRLIASDDIKITDDGSSFSVSIKII